jgi:ferredoxin
MAEIDHNFGKELRKYGAFDFNACYNCGTCTAICNLSTEENSFPREMIRFSTLGLKDDLKSSLKPWLCYYCGDCSIHCPQEANPGELMMSLRRWLTASYDWTGISGLLYRSSLATFLIFVLVAAGVIVFALMKNLDQALIMNAGHSFEIIAVAAVMGLILMPNIVRMWWFTVFRKGGNLKKYITGLKELFIHMFTQKNSLICETERFRWFEHLILVFGYLGLLFTTIFLDWFSTDNLFVIILGYAESLIILFVTIHFIISRIRKGKEVNKFSQPSDWLFVVWLSAMGITAFAVRLFIDAGLLETNFWLYILHLVILVQWAIIIVPFGKWTHFLYRSFAIGFSNIRESVQ